MKLLAVSDEESKYIWDHFDRERFGKLDLVISCGDLKAEYLSFLCDTIPSPVFYVPGNHDKGFETDPPQGCLPLDGRLVTCRGVRIAGLGGCRSPRYAPPYELSEALMAKKAKKLAREIARAGGLDILVTHAPAYGMGDGEDLFHQGFEVFREILDAYRPRYHLFGHQHRRYNARCSAEMDYNGTKVLNVCPYRLIEDEGIDMPRQGACPAQ